MQNETVIVLDFGGQYNQLIARRVRECNVYCEVMSYKNSIEKIKEKNPVGIIFTGGPNSVYDEKSPHYDKAIFELGIPILGICYGSQLMAYTLGGHVDTAPVSEYGKTEITTSESKLFENVDKNTVPSNGTATITNLTNYFLEDKSGNPVITNNGKTYLQRDGRNIELQTEDATGEYYIENNNSKEYIELTTPPLIAKIDMKANTVVTSSMIAKSDEKTTADLRVQEYNMLRLSSQIAAEDYIDIRFRLPSGLDYIVVSKKKVEIPQIDGVDSANTIWLQLTEDEILAMSNAIVENYLIEGSVLYTAKYVEPGTQEKATPTYVPSAEVQSLMRDNDSNIVNTAKMALLTRYNSNTSVRDNINSSKNSIDVDDATSNISSGVKQEVSTAQEQRQDYLDALSGN